MTVTWDNRVCSCRSMREVCQKKVAYTSWKPFSRSTPSAGFSRRHFFPSCGCGGWNAMRPAATPRRSTAASWCCELKYAQFDKTMHGGNPGPAARESSMKDLKEKTIRGGVARLCAQGANFRASLGSLMVLARLLDPKDFGLVGMVTAFHWSAEALFRDFGLSSAAMSNVRHVTEEQSSTLFWINVLVGAILAVLVVALAPVALRPSTTNPDC